MCRRGLRYNRIDLLRLCLFAAQFELHAPPMWRLPRFTPQFKRTNLGEAGSEAYGQVHVALLAIPQRGHQRRMTMYARFVQCSDVAVYISPCTRTVKRERHRTVSQHGEFAFERRKCGALF